MALKWRLCLLLFLATTLNYLDRQTMSILAPILQKEMHLDNGALGWLFAVFYYTYTFSQMAGCDSHRGALHGPERADAWQRHLHQWHERGRTGGPGSDSRHRIRQGLALGFHCAGRNRRCLVHRLGAGYTESETWPSVAGRPQATRSACGKPRARAWRDPEKPALSSRAGRSRSGESISLFQRELASHLRRATARPFAWQRVGVDSDRDLSGARSGQPALRRERSGAYPPRP